MIDPNKTEKPTETVTAFRDELASVKGIVRGIVLGNTINAGEKPAPTFGEKLLTTFIRDRFKESNLTSISIDEEGNAAGLLAGTGENRRTILVAAHADKIWPEEVSHSIDVSESELTGRGIADNSLGVGALISLPLVLEKLGIELNSDLLLVGTTKSFGRGDLAGMRFFLENTHHKIAAGICLEGIELGRLGFSSLGMLRGKIYVKSRNEGSSEAIALLSRILSRILAIETPAEPKTEVLLGSIDAGSGYNVPPTNCVLRFEIRSEDAEIVSRIHRRIEEIVDETDALGDSECRLKVLARRTPGDIGFGHPLVKSAREILKKLDVEPRVAPSISELSALLDRQIPGLTLGITRGKNRHTEMESVEIAPIFTGLAQIISILQFIDAADDETLNFSQDVDHE